MPDELPLEATEDDDEGFEMADEMLPPLSDDEEPDKP
jgi:hypothetical protein